MPAPSRTTVLVHASIHAVDSTNRTDSVRTPQSMYTRQNLAGMSHVGTASVTNEPDWPKQDPQQKQLGAGPHFPFNIINYKI